MTIKQLNKNLHWLKGFLMLALCFIQVRSMASMLDGIVWCIHSRKRF